MNEMLEHCSQTRQIGNKGKEGLAYKHKRAGNTETQVGHEENYKRH